MWVNININLIGQSLEAICPWQVTAMMLINSPIFQVLLHRNEKQIKQKISQNNNWVTYWLELKWIAWIRFGSYAEWILRDSSSFPCNLPYQYSMKSLKKGQKICLKILLSIFFTLPCTAVSLYLIRRLRIC